MFLLLLQRLFTKNYLSWEVIYYLYFKSVLLLQASQKFHFSFKGKEGRRIHFLSWGCCNKVTKLGDLVQFSSVAQWCLTLCDPMNRSIPGLPVHHQLPESTQNHAHRVDDAIQPSHPLLSPSPAPNPSQHQDLFQ